MSEVSNPTFSDMRNSLLQLEFKHNEPFSRCRMGLGSMLYNPTLSLAQSLTIYPLNIREILRSFLFSSIGVRDRAILCTFLSKSTMMLTTHTGVI